MNFGKPLSIFLNVMIALIFIFAITIIGLGVHDYMQFRRIHPTTQPSDYAIPIHVYNNQP